MTNDPENQFQRNVDDINDKEDMNVLKTLILKGSVQSVQYKSKQCTLRFNIKTTRKY